MTQRDRQRLRTEITPRGACDLLESVVANGTRDAILDEIDRDADVSVALAGLRSAMRSHTFLASTRPVALQRYVQALDARTKNEGFHLLESWDYNAHCFARDITPVLMLDRCAPSALTATHRRASFGVLLDYYFLCLLGLVAARAWDDADPGPILDKVTQLLRALGGAEGSGRHFVDDAETLLLLATSQYHPDERGYRRLLERVASLDEPRRLSFAIACAATFGSHLRWGFRFMYKRDVAVMRADNVVDYPWLLFSVVTLVRAYDKSREPDADGAVRDRIAEALINALSADPWAFTGKVPEGIEDHRLEHGEVRAWIHENRAALPDELEIYRPRTSAYSPLAFQCNFLCNAFVAMVATALMDQEPHPSLNALLTGRSGDGFSSQGIEAYARTLMAYARGGSDRPPGPALIVYDPYEAQHSFNLTLQVLRDGVGYSAVR